MLPVKKRVIAAYMSPVSITLFTVGILPIIYTVFLSFTNYGGLFHTDSFDYVGLKNYVYFLGKLNGDFYYVLGITILYVISCVSLFLVVGFITALALNNRNIKFLPVWRGILILPWAVPNLVSALIWQFLLGDTYGPFNQIIRLVPFFHWGGIGWLDTPTLAFFSVVMVNLWLSYPFFSVLILGALQSVPAELSEAAAIDGANAWQRFSRVTLPLLIPAILPATILSTITTFQMFNTVYLITGGGPGITPLHAGSTEFVMIYVYNKIFAGTIPLYGQVAAYSVLIFFILLAMTLLVFRTSNIAKGA